MYSKSEIYSQDIKVDQQTLYLSLNITGKSNKNLKDIQTSGAYFILFYFFIITCSFLIFHYKLSIYIVRPAQTTTSRRQALV